MRKWYRRCAMLLCFVLMLGWWNTSYVATDATPIASYIKWVDFDVTASAMQDALHWDIESEQTQMHISWIDILSCYAAKTGGKFTNYKKASMQVLYEALQAGKSGEEISGNEKLYRYYQKAYTAVLGGMVGYYSENGVKKYGLCAFSPIARGYSYSHYDDFGASRSYGYHRPHLGHDLMGTVGTPIIAVEGGIVEAVGWNQYGGWRIGIRSFDSTRYYYYAHLRRNHPYRDMYEGKIVQPGEVIGYLGMTGYSAKENTNNINTPHLHYGLELIFDPSQKDGNCQIWVDMYQLTLFLEQNRSRVRKNEATNEYDAVNEIVSEWTPD